MLAVKEYQQNPYKIDKIQYSVPCECNKAYIGETRIFMNEHM